MTTDYPPIHQQLRHVPISRLLTALAWLDYAGQPLKGRTLDQNTPNTTRKQEGHDTAWTRKAHRNYLNRIDQLAIEIENRLDPQHGTHQKPDRVRCKGPNSCGRWLTNDSQYCRHCGIKVESDT